jgi:hypothetical protein
MNLIIKIVKDRKLVVYGGYAIHLALKYKGHSGIYSDEQLPDLDIYSNGDFYKLSNEIGLELFNAGFVETSVITAIHPSTRKIRVELFNLLDISYLNFDIPTLDVGTFIIIDPIFQRLSLYLSLSMPYSVLFSENISFRQKKDTHRLRLFDEYYPIYGYYKEDKIHYKTVTQTINREYYYTGMLAYGLYYKHSKEQNRLVEVKVDITGNKVNLSIPNNLPDHLSIYEYHDEFKEFTKYGSFYDFLPKRRISKTLEVLSLKYSIQCFNIIDDVKVLHLYQLHLYFLCMYFLLKDNIYLRLLNSVIIMMKSNGGNELFSADKLDPFGDLNNNFTLPEQFLKKIKDKNITPLDVQSDYLTIFKLSA